MRFTRSDSRKSLSIRAPTPNCDAFKGHFVGSRLSDCKIVLTFKKILMASRTTSFVSRSGQLVTFADATALANQQILGYENVFDRIKISQPTPE